MLFLISWLNAGVPESGLASFVHFPAFFPAAGWERNAWFWKRFLLFCSEASTGVKGFPGLRGAQRPLPLMAARPATG
jgi:hypothetical protein